MGFFNKLGQQVEQFKQTAKASAEEPDYQCRACDAQFYSDYDECPECGAEELTSQSSE